MKIDLIDSETQEPISNEGRHSIDSKLTPGNSFGVTVSHALEIPVEPYYTTQPMQTIKIYKLHKIIEDGESIKLIVTETYSHTITTGDL